MNVIFSTATQDGRAFLRGASRMRRTEHTHGRHARSTPREGGALRMMTETGAVAVDGEVDGTDTRRRGDEHEGGEPDRSRGWCEEDAARGSRVWIMVLCERRRTTIVDGAPRWLGTQARVEKGRLEWTREVEGCEEGGGSDVRSDVRGASQTAKVTGCTSAPERSLDDGCARADGGGVYGV